MATKYIDEANGQQNIRHLSGFLVGEEVISECEVMFEGEGDLLETRFSKCPKNPGHPTFIPVSKFTVEHIPAQLRTNENIELIQRKIDQTVRIRVSYTSLDRPNFFSDINAPYPYARYKGSSRAIRYGTGGIHRVLSPQPIKDKLCPCHLCVSSGNPESEHWLITVRTATHVIYDDSEAERATFDCFFDSEDSANVKTLYGICIDGTNTSQNTMYKSDSVEIVCVTHDGDLMKKIIIAVSGADTLQLPHMLTSELPPEGVIVSHPHGCSKRITFGNIQHVTVPVKPAYETNSSIPFPDGTECRLKSDQYTQDADSVSSFVSFLHKRATDSLASDGKCRNTNSLSKTKRESQTTISPFNTFVDKEGTNSQQKSHEQQIGQGKSEENAQNKPLTEIYSEFYDEAIKNAPQSTQFNYNSLDKSAVGEIADCLNDQNIPTNLTALNCIGKLMPSMVATTHTSKQCSGKEYDANDASYFRRSAIDLMTNYSDSRGIGVDTIDPVMNILKESLPSLMNQTLPHDQQQSSWTDMLGKMFNVGIKIGVDRFHNNDGTAGASTHSGNENIPSDDPAAANTNTSSFIENGVVTSNARNDCHVNNNDLCDDKNVHSTIRLNDDVSGSGDNKNVNPTQHPMKDDIYKDDADDGASDSVSIMQRVYHEQMEGINGPMRTLLERMGFEDFMTNVAKLFDDAPEPSPMKEFLPGDNFGVPLGVKFILPTHAEYAMRYRKENPGWFELPPGTEIENASGNVIPLPEGAEFRNPTFHPQHSFISYDIDTCPGSSGAAVYCKILGNTSMTYFPHSGSSGICNLSAVHENKLFPMMSHVMQGMMEMFGQLGDMTRNIDSQPSVEPTDFAKDETISQKMAEFDLD